MDAQTDYLPEAATFTSLERLILAHEQNISRLERWMPILTGDDAERAPRTIQNLRNQVVDLRQQQMDVAARSYQGTMT
ncbi:hypothetical protein [Pseudomonas indica]|uniref:hypothetical protein n=1 Tax=Pseudomonas indica TaxID=137658 RepID=UPI003FD4A8EE